MRKIYHSGLGFLQSIDSRPRGAICHADQLLLLLYNSEASQALASRFFVFITLAFLKREFSGKISL
jgi:hypothetical protein